MGWIIDVKKAWLGAFELLRLWCMGKNLKIFQQVIYYEFLIEILMKELKYVVTKEKHLEQR